MSMINFFATVKGGGNIPPVSGGNLLLISLGDSNIRGNGDASPLLDASNEFKGSFSSIKMWETNSFVTLDTDANTNQYPIVQRNDAFSFHLPFAIEMLNNYDNIYHYSYGYGGSKLSAWIPSANNYYTTTLNELEDAYDYFDNNGIVFDKKIMLVHLGTNDVENANEANYTSLINGYRNDLDSELEVVLFKLGLHLIGVKGSEAEVNNARQAAIDTSTTLTNVDAFSNDNAEVYAGDAVHYTADGNEAIAASLYTLY